MGWIICLLLVVIIFQLNSMNNLQNVVIKSQKYLAAMEGMLYMIYLNSEKREGVEQGDRIPRSNFSEWYQDRYGLETSLEASARIRDAKEEREEKAKKKK